MKWLDVPADIVERTRVACQAVRGSNESWEAFVATLVPGRVMDVVTIMSVVGHRRLEKTSTAPCVSTDIDQAMGLTIYAECTVSISYRPQIRADDPTEEVRAEVTCRAHDGSYYVGEGVHRPADDYLDPDDIARMAEERAVDPDDVGGYHECGKGRCVADAVTRALLMMYSPTEEELSGVAEVAQ